MLRNYDACTRRLYQRQSHYNNKNFFKNVFEILTEKTKLFVSEEIRNGCVFIVLNEHMHTERTDNMLQ